MCAISSVEPSLGCCASYSAARTPATPALVSTMTCWFHIWVSLAATTRASASVPPPGGKPTTMRTGAFGHSWASRRGAARVATAAPVAWRRVRRCIVVVPVSSIERRIVDERDPPSEWLRGGGEPGARRMAREMLHRRLDSAPGNPDAGELEPHLAAGERAEQRQVVAVAEMADPEHAALDLAEAGAEREVEALVDQPAHRVGVDAGRHDHAGQHRRPALRLDALDRQLPGVDGGANALGPALMAGEDVVEPLAEQHLERLVEAVE